MVGVMTVHIISYTVVVMQFTFTFFCLFCHSGRHLLNLKPVLRFRYWLYLTQILNKKSQKMRTTEYVLLKLKFYFHGDRFYPKIHNIPFLTCAVRCSALTAIGASCRSMPEMTLSSGRCSLLGGLSYRSYMGAKCSP